MKISKLHYITQGNAATLSHALAADAACTSGVRWVQLRLKNISDEHSLETAERCREICDLFGATFIMNDRVQLAKAVGADGVHLGKEDMSPLEARKILGDDAIIGATANSMEDILELSAMKVDYIGLGPFRFTSSKDKLSPILGLGGYQKIIEACRTKEVVTPIIAIGGIGVADIDGLMKTGVHGIAVASLINSAEDKRATVAAIYGQLGLPVPVLEQDHFAKAQ